MIGYGYFWLFRRHSKKANSKDTRKMTSSNRRQCNQEIAREIYQLFSHGVADGRLFVAMYWWIDLLQAWYHQAQRQRHAFRRTKTSHIFITLCVQCDQLRLPAHVIVASALLRTNYVFIDGLERTYSALINNLKNLNGWIFIPDCFFTLVIPRMLRPPLLPAQPECGRGAVSGLLQYLMDMISGANDSNPGLYERKNDNLLVKRACSGWLWWLNWLCRVQITDSPLDAIYSWQSQRVDTGNS